MRAERKVRLPPSSASSLRSPALRLPSYRRPAAAARLSLALDVAQQRLDLVLLGAAYSQRGGRVGGVSRARAGFVPFGEAEVEQALADGLRGVEVACALLVGAEEEERLGSRERWTRRRARFRLRVAGCGRGTRASLSSLPTASPCASRCATIRS